MREIKRIFHGLPESLNERVLWVARHFRTNPLSHIPGGSDVVVEYHDTRVFGYDWIKFPSAYIGEIMMNYFSEYHRDFREYDRDEQFKVIKDDIKRVFARKSKPKDFEAQPFKEVWNFETSSKLPWEVLKEFDEIGIDEYIRRQQESPEFQKHLMEEALRMKRSGEINEYINRQQESPEFQKHLIEKVLEEERLYYLRNPLEKPKTNTTPDKNSQPPKDN